MIVYLRIFVQTLLTDVEIKTLTNGLDYAPIQNKINEPELRRCL